MKHLSPILPIRSLFDISANSLMLGETDLTLSVESLPRELPDGRIWVGPLRTGYLRCHIDYGPVINRGGYALIQKVVRTSASGQRTLAMVVKRPRMPSINFGSEALLQWLSREVLELIDCEGAVAQVLDIFQLGGEVRFSMEYIEGRSALAYCLSAVDPSAALVDILRQVAFLLHQLEERLGFDHRDMKADNLWIREGVPIHYTHTLPSGIQVDIHSPFQVVLLDFGFACLGGEDGHARINLGDGVFPALDPCPKGGRDMFQLLTSFWSVPSLRTRLSPKIQSVLGPFVDQMQTAAAAAGISTRDPAWTYRLTRQSRFSIPCLEPRRMLEILQSY